ncbi:MAG TPA: SAM-dependent methyltransferase, partial [Zeimonas sp.]
MLERQVTKYLGTLREKHPIPLRVRLWDGSTVELDESPRVELRVRDVGAARYLLNPSLSALGEAFVEGHVDVEGDIREIIPIAERLSLAGDEEKS